MSHCVPDWDGLGGELEAILATADFYPRVASKGKGGSLLQRKALASDFALVGDPDAILSPWSEQMIATQPTQPGGGKPAHWQANCPNGDWSGERQPNDAVTASKPPVNYMPPSVVKESCLAVDVPIVDTAMNTSSHQDDEMVSWLQYPPDESQYKLDETLESAYCSDFFGELPQTNISTVQSLKDSFAMVGQQSTAGPRTGRNSPMAIAGNSSIGSLSRVASADAAMALGAGRAAGLLPQAGGVEAFTKVRTTMQPKLTFNSNSPPAKNAGAQLTSMCAPGGKTTAADSSVPSPARPLKSQPAGPSEQYGRLRRMNFPHFSRPAVQARARASLVESLGSQQPAAVVAVARLKGSPLGGSTRPFDASRSSASSIAESTTTRQQPSGISRKDVDIPVKDAEGQQQQQRLGGDDDSPWLSAAPNSRLKDADAPANSVVDHVESGAQVTTGDRSSPGSREDSEAQGVAGKCLTQAAPELQEPPEATLTSSSGGSGNSSCRGKGVSSSSAQKRAREDEAECQSDDAEEQVELKKPARTGTAKRTRAAEVHNMSERRRRDRINEKMKALQELIPNSNKSDKASMLDEAIAYLKMLQVQIAEISAKSGLSIPNMIPAGMQHLQMPQMLPSMGIRMGIGPMVGVGMGMMDMNCMNATGRPSHPMSHPYHHGGPPTHAGSHLMPHPSQHGGPSYSVSQMLPHPSSAVGQSMPATPPAVSLIDSHNLRVPSNSALESVYLSRQHPLHLSHHPQAMDVYGAYMLHQQQQQLLHHFPNNVSGVNPHQLSNSIMGGNMYQSPSAVSIGGGSHLLPSNIGGGSLHPSTSNISGGGSQ